MAGAGRRRTPQRVWQDSFVAALAGGATITRAATVAGVVRATVYEARDRDPEFAARWDDAYDQGSDLLEEEARRRAEKGVDKPVFFRGQEVGYVREYSDTLMLAMLKARKPDQYRERYDVKHSGQIARPTAEELAANRDQGLDEQLETALGTVASLDAARARRKAG